MTKRKSADLLQIGNIIEKYRKNLSLKKDTRAYFLEDRIEKGILSEDSISEKTLANIENGYNLPNLITLKYLSFALEVDLIQLIKEIIPYIPNR